MTTPAPPAPGGAHAPDAEARSAPQARPGRPLAVLLVEDSEDDATLLLRELKRSGYEPDLLRVDTEEAMQAALDEKTWDVVIADYTMPRFSGLEALKLVQRRGLDVPFIIVSGSIGEDLAVAAMKAGAHDYVMKANLVRLSPAIRRELDEAAVRSERSRMEARLQHDALHDGLTGLPNRALFFDRLEHALARWRGRDDATIGVLAVSLDRFDVIVGGVGHVEADRLLVAVAERLMGCVGPADTVARLAGDEFAVLLDGATTVGAPLETAERIQRELAQPIALQGEEVFITASVGIVLGRPDETPSELLRDANTAMHRARSKGTGRQEVFDKGMHARAVEILKLQAGLRRALERHELVVHYQPIVRLRDRSLSGFEALMRWQHPEHGLVVPDAFIPAAEDCGLIVPMGSWILEDACRQVRAWQDLRPDGPLTIGVNLSAQQFGRPDLVTRVASVVEASGLDPALLHLEITESVVMGDAATSAQVLRDLKALGVMIVIDDFGTGYSSLSYLHRFPIDTLKIDKSFVSRMSTQEDCLGIVRTIVTLAHDMGLDVVAEGVETAEERSLLESMGCERAQGFLFSEPVAPGVAEPLIASDRTW